MNDCDRKVGVNKRRLEETQDQETLGPEAQAVHELNEQIGIKLAEAEELGEHQFVNCSPKTQIFQIRLRGLTLTKSGQKRDLSRFAEICRDLPGSNKPMGGRHQLLGDPLSQAQAHSRLNITD